MPALSALAEGGDEPALAIFNVGESLGRVALSCHRVETPNLGDGTEIEHRLLVSLDFHAENPGGVVTEGELRSLAKF